MPDLEAQFAEFREDFRRVRAEVAKVLVGQDETVLHTLVALFAGGHVLLEGVPGLGKTLLVRTLARVLDLEYSRIQFTPDLMPADIIGTRLVVESDAGRRSFEFQRGPVFAQILLADEVNRATPKTQSALLEAMQEHEVTVGRESHKLREPFLVLATQNPLEMDGTYPLPEAQLDRFLLKVNVPFPTREELAEVLARTTDVYHAQLSKVLDGSRIIELQELVRQVIVAPHVRDYAVRVLLATHPDQPGASEPVRKFVRYGGSPRGVQAMLLGAKILAALDGRYNVGFEDLRRIAPPALRHRMILNFEAEAEGQTSDAILRDILAEVPELAQDASLAS